MSTYENAAANNVVRNRSLVFTPDKSAGTQRIDVLSVINTQINGVNGIVGLCPGIHYYQCSIAQSVSRLDEGQ